jgi:hypothetical protein
MKKHILTLTLALLIGRHNTVYAQKTDSFILDSMYYNLAPMQSSDSLNLFTTWVDTIKSQSNKNKGQVIPKKPEGHWQLRNNTRIGWMETLPGAVKNIYEVYNYKKPEETYSSQSIFSAFGIDSIASNIYFNGFEGIIPIARDHPLNRKWIAILPTNEHLIIKAIFISPNGNQTSWCITNTYYFSKAKDK